MNENYLGDNRVGYEEKNRKENELSVEMFKIPA